MDEEELDQWYDSQKERLTEEYQLKLKKAEEKLREERRIKLLEEEARKKQAEADKKAGKPVEEKPVEEEKPKKDFHDVLKKQFLAKMKKLHKAYDIKSKNLVKKNLKRHFQNHRMKMLKKKLFKPIKEYKDMHSKKKEEA